MPQHARPRQWLILGVLCISVFLVAVDNTIVNVALPSLARNLHASNSALQWIVDGYSLPFAGLLLAGGGLADRFGRRRVMQLALVGFLFFSLFAAFSHNVAQLLTARALMGASAAFIFPATLSVLSVVFADPGERAKAFGFWGATAGVAIAVGPIAGGALLAHFWTGSIFLVNAPLILIDIVAIWAFVPESKSPQRRRLDGGGLILGTFGITALVLAIIEGPAWGWRSPTTLALFATAAVLTTGFTRFEMRRAGPLLDVRVFSNRVFSSSAGAIATNFFCLFGFIFLVTQYFQLVRGYSALSAGVRTLPFAATVMVTTPLGATAALKVGTRFVVSTGLVLTAVALFWMSAIGARTPYFGPVVESMIVLAIGFSLVNAPSTAALMETLTPEQIGAGASVNETTRELGGTMGVAVIGSVFSSLFGPQVRTALEPFLVHGLSTAQLSTAQSSMLAAQVTVAHLPPHLRPDLDNRVVSAFMDGLHRGCIVAGMTALSVAILVFFNLRQAPTPAKAVDAAVSA
ncbi:MAG: MFS transporter [Acidimicrobiaceae bacterium]|nr:MFS transporter [Acidimicrobiaceae bacterium]